MQTVQTGSNKKVASKSTRRVVVLTYKEKPKHDTTLPGKTVHTPGSNFWEAEDGWNVEAQFQAEKHEGHPFRQVIIRQCPPGVAKKLGRQWKLTDEERRAWDRRKWYVMRGLLREKLFFIEFVQWLKDTGDSDIVEVNWWHDNYWGDCSCIKCYHTGNNHLGKLLMSLRKDLRDQQVKAYDGR